MLNLKKLNNNSSADKEDNSKSLITSHRYGDPKERVVPKQINKTMDDRAVRHDSQHVRRKSLGSMG